MYITFSGDKVLQAFVLFMVKGIGETVLHKTVFNSLSQQLLIFDSNYTLFIKFLRAAMVVWKSL